MASRRVVLVGEAGIEVDGVLHGLPGRQAALVFVYLICERSHPVRREDLADLLWPDHLPPHWPGAVRGVLARVRSFVETTAPGAAEVTSKGGVVHVAVARGVAVDIEDDLVLGERGSVSPLSLLVPDFLATEDGPWVRRQRERVFEHRRLAMLEQVDGLLHRGEATEAIPYLAALVESNPYDEEAVRLSMRTNLAAGRRAAALGDYERLRLRLDDELGVRPADATDAVLRHVLGDAPTVSTPVALAEPDWMVGESGSSFVGRSGEIEQLDALVDASGGLRLALVEGETGIGKTRLVSEWLVRRRSTKVLWGRCTGGRLAFGPFVEALARHFDADPDSITRLGASLGPLAPVFPGHGTTNFDPGSVDPGLRRTLLFRAFSSAIADATREAGAVLVIDDLQAADDDTLDLLGYLAHALADKPLVVVLIVREPGARVAELLAELARRGSSRVTVGGLSLDDVGTLIAATGIPDAGDRTLVERVYARTDGHPLYVRQLIDDARTHGRRIDPTMVPSPLRGLIARRVESLPPSVANLLSLAAVAGEAVNFDLLSACTSHPPPRLLDLLGELEGLGFLVSHGAGWFGWTHELVRDAVIAAIPATRSASLHLRVAEALDGSAPPTEVAAHYRRSGAAGRAGAIRLGLEAGAVALQQSAWAAAAEEFTLVEAMASLGEERAVAAAGRGWAERGRGRMTEAHECFTRVLDVGRATKNGRLIAEAALGLVGGGGRGVSTHLCDDERALLLREAADGLRPDLDDDLAVPVMCELALALVLTPGTERERAVLVDRTLSTARRHGDPGLVAAALLGRRTVLVDAVDAGERLSDSSEVLAMPRDTLRVENRLAASLAVFEDLLVLGRRDEADAILEVAAREASLLDHPYWSWSTTAWKALACIADARFDEAEELAYEAVAHRPDHPEAVAAFGVQFVNIRLYQGRADEVVGLLDHAAEANPHLPAYRAVLALAAARAGDVRLATSAYEHFAEAGCANLPFDSNRFLALVVLAETCWRLEDVSRARMYSRLIEPYRDKHAVLNCYGGGGAYWGPVHDQLRALTALDPLPR